MSSTHNYMPGDKAGLMSCCDENTPNLNCPIAIPVHSEQFETMYNKIGCLI